MRIGRWADAVAANVAAWRTDVADAAACQSPYEPEHNTDMLVYAANMAGQVQTPILNVAHNTCCAVQEDACRCPSWHVLCMVTCNKGGCCD